MPSFHSETIRLLRTTPRESQTAISEICGAEKRLGIQLPASVREWYSCGDAVRVLAAHSNDDHPFRVRDFQLATWSSKTLLQFKLENQGVCLWAILLDGADDPSVYVNVAETGWRQQTETFSSYVYSCVWDYAVVFAKPALVQAQNEPISNHAIATLTADFAAELTTHGWPGNTQYRFTGNRLAILIWAAGDQADWFVAADDSVAMRHALDVVWELDGVGGSFYHCSEIGKAVLEAFRQEA